MKYSLINVEKDHGNGLIDGTWIQNYTGDLDGAKERAKGTEQVNSNRIKVAVVEALSYIPDYSLRLKLEKL